MEHIQDKKIEYFGIEKLDLSKGKKGYFPRAEGCGKESTQTGAFDDTVRTIIETILNEYLKEFYE